MAYDRINYSVRTFHISLNLNQNFHEGMIDCDKEEAKNRVTQISESKVKQKAIGVEILRVSNLA